MHELGLCEDERFSDLPDEVQVKDRISLDKMHGMLFPVDNFLVSKVFVKRSKMIEAMKIELETIRNMLNHYGYNVDLYDTSTLTPLNDETIKELTLK